MSDSVELTSEARKPVVAQPGVQPNRDEYRTTKSGSDDSQSQPDSITTEQNIHPECGGGACRYGDGLQTCGEIWMSKTVEDRVKDLERNLQTTTDQYSTAIGGDLQASLTEQMAKMMSEQTTSTIKPDETIKEKVLQNVKNIKTNQEKSVIGAPDETGILEGALGGSQKPPLHALGAGAGILDLESARPLSASTPMPIVSQTKKPKKVPKSATERLRHKTKSAEDRMKELEKRRLAELKNPPITVTHPGGITRPPSIQPFGGANPENPKEEDEKVSEDKIKPKEKDGQKAEDRAKEIETELRKFIQPTNNPSETEVKNVEKVDKEIEVVKETELKRDIVKPEDSESTEESESTSMAKAYEALGRTIGQLSQEVNQVKNDLEDYQLKTFVEWGNAKDAFNRQNTTDWRVAEIKTKLEELEKDLPSIWSAFSEITNSIITEQRRSKDMEIIIQNQAMELNHLRHDAKIADKITNKRITDIENQLANRVRNVQTDARGTGLHNIGPTNYNGPINQGFGTQNTGQSQQNHGQNQQRNQDPTGFGGFGNGFGMMGGSGGGNGGQNNRTYNVPPPTGNQAFNYTAIPGRVIQLKADTFPKLTGFNKSRKLSIQEFASWKSDVNLRLQMNIDIASLPIDRLIAAIIVGMGEEASQMVRTIVKQTNGSYHIASIDEFYDKVQEIAVGSGGHIKSEAMNEFNNCDQKPDEDTSMYGARLYATFKTAFPENNAMNWAQCNFRFIRGLASNRTRERLLLNYIPVRHPHTDEVPPSEEGYQLLLEYSRKIEAAFTMVKQIKLNKGGKFNPTPAIGQAQHRGEPMVLGALKRAENTKPRNAKPGKSVKIVKKRTARPTRTKKKESDKKPYSKEAWEAIKERAREAGQCFKCFKTGHFANKCPEPIALLEALEAAEDEVEDETEDDNDDPNLEDDDSETEDEEQTDDDEEEEEVVSTVDTAATVFQDLDHLTEEQWDWVSENWVSRTQSPQ